MLLKSTSRTLPVIVSLALAVKENQLLADRSNGALENYRSNLVEEVFGRPGIEFFFMDFYRKVSYFPPIDLGYDRFCHPATFPAEWHAPIIATATG